MYIQYTHEHTQIYKTRTFKRKSTDSTTWGLTTLSIEKRIQGIVKDCEFQLKKKGDIKHA